MDPSNYYVTTLVNAFTKIAPYVAFIVGGYFVFIKLPFLFLRKSMEQQKKKLQEESKEIQPVVPKMKVLNGPEIKKKEEPKKKVERPQRTAQEGQSPEEILGFKPNEAFTKADLKKRYFDKLKENHPDRVASMGEDFKKLAEKNTKEINKAYDKLKNRAA